MDIVESLLKTTLGEIEKVLSTKTVVGDPLVLEGTTLIPLISAGFGFGAGGGSGRGESKQKGEGTGGGTGGGAYVKPVAVVVIDKDGVRVEPVIDITKIALAGLTASAFMLGMLMRLLSPKKALKDIQRGNWE